MTDEPIPEISSEKGKVLYADKLIHIDNGSLLIGRIITNHENTESFICVYKPVEIMVDEFSHTNMRPWIPESVDDFFTIPNMKVLNVSTPRLEFLEAYHANFLAVQTPEESLHGEDRILH
jgi:hypothetical protein